MQHLCLDTILIFGGNYAIMWYVVGHLDLYVAVHDTPVLNKFFHG